MAERAESGDAFRVGVIHARVATLLGLPTESSTVWMHTHTIAHIVAQRAAAVGDADFVLEQLAFVIGRPDLVGIEPRDVRRIRLVSFIPTTRRLVHVSLKRIAAADGMETLWVSSAFPLGRRSLTRLQRREKLQGVEWEDDR